MASIIVGYDIDFVWYIRDEIHEKAFKEITNIPFPYFIQRLCDTAGVPALSSIDHHIEVTQVTDVGLIRDDTNPVAQKKAQPSTSFGAALFEGSLESGKKLDRPALDKWSAAAGSEGPQALQLQLLHLQCLLTRLLRVW